MRSIFKSSFHSGAENSDGERIKELLIVLGGERCVGSGNDEEGDGDGDAASPSPVFCPLGQDQC